MAKIAVRLKIMCPNCGPLDGFYRRQPKAMTMRCPHCRATGCLHHYVGPFTPGDVPLPCYIKPRDAVGA